MAVKVMGITAGRKDSNSEILLKEALMYCEEAGADVTMINLKDYHIESCTGCTSCTRGMAQGKHTGCVLDEKDDKKKIMEVMLDQDAVIFSAPTYDLMPNAEYLIFAQRSLSYETAFLETIGAIDHKDRVAGLICAGGSTRAWQSMALEAMQATMFTTDMKVVDMILATRVPGRAQCLLDDALMARARKMGEHIMKAAATPPGERGWLGDGYGLVSKLSFQCPGAGRTPVGRAALSRGMSGLRRGRRSGTDRGWKMEICHPKRRISEGPHHSGRPGKAPGRDRAYRGRILCRAKESEGGAGKGAEV